MAKTIKLLADGTIAKVGMIVYHSSGYIGKIVLIRTGSIYKIGNSIYTHRLRSGEIRMEIADKSFSVIPSNMRKATKEERKQYYKQFYSNQNE